IWLPVLVNIAGCPDAWRAAIARVQNHTSARGRPARWAVSPFLGDGGIKPGPGTSHTGREPARMFLNRARRLNERALPGHMLFGPRHIVLGVNNFCNLRCVMCDVGTGNSETNFGGNLTGAKTRTMSWDTFKLVADETRAAWPGAHLNFVYTEPLA